MKPQRIRHRSHKAGLPPGSIVYVGQEQAGPVAVNVIEYTKDAVEEKTIENIEDCALYKDKDSTVWINIDGLHQPDIIKQIGKVFDLHPLMLEDVVNTEQRPKFEAYDDHLFIILKMLRYDENQDVIKVEQVALVLFRNMVISFQEPAGDLFDPIRARIRNLKSRLHKEDASYLAYTLIDAIVDHYFYILEKLNERIEDLSDQITYRTPTPKLLNEIHVLKRQALFLRKSIWPLREVLSQVGKDQNQLLSDATQLYFRDVLDHTVQIIDNLEILREMLSALLDVYLSNINIRTNEVIKILTIIGTIFIPLTFITSIYGMNFKYMPELKWHYGYPMVMGVMALIVIGICMYFRKKQWI